MKLKILFITLSLLLPFHMLFAESVTIHGNIAYNGVEPVQNADIDLFWINPNAKEGEKKLNHLQSAKSSDEGRYSFLVTNPRQGGFYVISSRFEANHITSDPLIIQKSQAEYRVDLQVSRTLTNLENLIVNKRIHLAEPDQGGLAITDVIIVENSMNSAMDGTKNPLKIQVPADIEEFTPLSRDLEITYNPDTNEVSIPFKMDPGQRQILFRYKLSSIMPAVSYQFNLAGKERAFEFMAPENLFKIELNGTSTPPEIMILEKAPFHVWKVADKAKTIKVRVNGLPSLLPQYIIGGVLALFLLGGLALFLRKSSLKG